MGEHGIEVSSGVHGWIECKPDEKETVSDRFGDFRCYWLRSSAASSARNPIEASQIRRRRFSFHVQSEQRV